jgi:aspartate racemase
MENPVCNFLTTSHKRRPIIGIIGGAGPDAAIDFQIKLSEAMKIILKAKTDEEHYRVIVDNNTQVNLSSKNYVESAQLLKEIGANIIAIACNSAHIYYKEINEVASPVLLINMIQETCEYISGYFKDSSPIGLLAVNETIDTQLYGQPLKGYGFKTIIPNPHTQLKVIEAIHGIKSGFYCKKYVNANINIYPYFQRVKFENQSLKHPMKMPLDLIEEAIKHLKQNGARCILLGCTELSLLLWRIKHKWDIPIIDPTLILAKNVIKSAKVIEDKWNIN